MPEPKSRKDQILTESIKYFYEYGYAKTTMRKIAEACGVSHPAIFKHFKNKAQMAEVLMYRYVHGVVQLTRQYIADRHIDIETSHEALAFYWTVHFHTMRHNDRLFWFIREYNAAQDFFKSPINEFLLQVFRKLLHWDYEKDPEEFWLYSKLLISSASIISFSCNQREISVEKAVIEFLYLLYSIIKTDRRITDDAVSRLIRTLDYDRYLGFDLVSDILLSDFGRPYDPESAPLFS